MRTIIAIALFAMLSGCASIQNFFAGEDQKTATVLCPPLCTLVSTPELCMAITEQDAISGLVEVGNLSRCLESCEKNYSEVVRHIDALCLFAVADDLRKNPRGAGTVCPLLGTCVK